MKAMHHFIFQNMIIDNSKLDKNSVFFLTGISNHRIEDILIKDVQFIVAGGGTKEDAVKTVKEYAPEVLGAQWPEFSLVGTLPAFGIYARHINGLTVDHFSVKTLAPDARSVVKFDNVQNLEMGGVKVNGVNLSKTGLAGSR